MVENKRIEIRLLGGASLYRNNQPLSGTAVRRHPLALLALLAIAPDYAISRPKVIGILWPDASESIGRNRLSSTLYPLRQAMGSEVLTAAADTLRLDPGRVTCDLWRFREALKSESKEDVVRLYGGPLLDGFYLENTELFEERIEGERRELDRAWRQAVRALAEQAERAQRHGEAAHRWQTLFVHDPLNSSVATRLVRELALAGRRHEALNIAKQHVEQMDEELGTSPDAVFMELLEQLKQSSSRSEKKPESSIAVLLFDSPEDAESKTLGEGIHAGILSRLATVEGLTVIARTSVRRYTDKDQSASEIGEELGVRWVLEGGVQTRHDQFRIDTRLIEADSNQQVWDYDHVGQLSAANYFSVQTKIADELFERLRHQVTPDERWRLARVPTENLEAYRQTTQARMHLDQRSPESMLHALKCFEEAVLLDPGYAIAWVGIADTLGLMHAYGFAGTDVLPRAQKAIRTALETDEFCAEAHAASGRMLGQLKDEAGAKRAIRRAVDLKPGYAEAHNWLTIGHHVSGDIEAAFDSARRAAALNPLSAEVLSNFASTLLFHGELIEALQMTERTLVLEPDYGTATFYSALALIELERFKEALETLNGLELPWVGAGVDTVRALAHAGLGDLERSRECLDTIRKTGYGFDEGLVLAALGEKENAFESFERTNFDGIEFAISYWPTVCARYLFKPVWASLKDDPRYATMLLRIERSWGLA